MYKISSLDHIVMHFHPPQTLSRNEISLNWRLLFLTKLFQLATTKVCCMTMFEVGGNNVALQQVVACITLL